jgi:hypothetical protein
MSMKPAAERPIYIIHLRPEPGVTDPIRVLRALLKVAWRNFHMRAISVRETTSSKTFGAPPALGAPDVQIRQRPKASVMDMREYRKARFLKVEDCRKPKQRRIAGVVLGRYSKPDIVFEDGDRLGLSATNTEILSDTYGWESENWVGHVVELSVGQGQFEGEAVDMVLIKPLSPAEGDEQSTTTTEPVRKAPNKRPDPMDEVVF